MLVPTMRPNKPTKTKDASFKSIVNLEPPLVWSQYVAHSTMAGSIKPKVDKQRAPNSEMNRSKLGTAIASETEEYGIT